MLPLCKHNSCTCLFFFFFSLEHRLPHKWKRRKASSGMQMLPRRCHNCEQHTNEPSLGAAETQMGLISLWSLCSSWGKTERNCLLPLLRNVGKQSAQPGSSQCNNTPLTTLNPLFWKQLEFELFFLFLLSFQFIMALSFRRESAFYMSFHTFLIQEAHSARKQIFHLCHNWPQFTWIRILCATSRYCMGQRRSHLLVQYSLILILSRTTEASSNHTR